MTAGVLSMGVFGRRLGVVAAALIWLWAGSLAALAQPEGSYGDDDPQSSFAELDRYGHWTQHPEWGTVWVPDVDADWRPYTFGRWVNTEEHGWYWDSEEPFGWAVFHYGRWVDDPDDGWIWIPGTEWGPAWVAWRYGEDAVGWAPLPPRAIWEPERGLLVDEEFYHGTRFAPYWIFLAPRYLLSPGLHRYALPASRNTSFFAHTRPATRYGWENRRVYNHGIGIGEVERLTRSRVATVGLLPAQRPGLNNRRTVGGPVYAYRPAIVPSDRWQSGRNGDWRRFEPAARPQTARQERNFTPQRPDQPRQPGRDPAFGRDNGQSSGQFGGQSGRGAGFGTERPGAAASAPPLPQPQGDRFRRDGEQSRSRPLSQPAPVAASPPSQPRFDTPRDERWRDEGRRGGEASQRPAGSPRDFREGSPPVAPRTQAAPSPARQQQQAAPPPRPAQPPAQAAGQRPPPPKKPDEVAPGQPPVPNGRRG